MGGESTEAWRTVLDDLIKRGLRRPEFLIVDGAPGLGKAIAAVWDGVPLQRRTVQDKTQTVLPSADTAAMLFWALLASGQVNMRKVDGWQTLATKPIDQPIDLAA